MCSWIAQWDLDAYRVLSRLSRQFAKDFVLNVAFRKDFREKLAWHFPRRFLRETMFCSIMEWHHRLSNQLHSLYEPAQISKWARGRVDIWYQDGQIHRDGDLPAFEERDGKQAWYKKGVLHRENGPALITSSGVEMFYKNGSIVSPFAVDEK